MSKMASYTLYCEYAFQCVCNAPYKCTKKKKKRFLQTVQTEIQANTLSMLSLGEIDFHLAFGCHDIIQRMLLVFLFSCSSASVSSRVFLTLCLLVNVGEECVFIQMQAACCVP